MNYQDFLNSKYDYGSKTGFQPIFIPDSLYDFQKHIVDWAIRTGRAAIFADCGMGKTPMQLVWAENVLRQTNKPVLILTPLAVSEQTLQEGQKFGITCHKSREGENIKDIVITNYERLGYFNPVDFGGVVLDESSILKNFNGQRKREITQFMKAIPYRLLCTATAAPNDYIELGTSSEALGYMGFQDMLGRFFKNDNNNTTLRRMYGEAPKWRFKGHAERDFWRWVLSWAIAVRKPSDIGFNDDAFILPELIEEIHIVDAMRKNTGMLFNLPAADMAEQRQEKKDTIEDRCDKVADLVNDTGKPALVWCQLNDEGNLLEKLIPDARQVKGGDSPEKKEDLLIGFAKGDFRVLISKPKIGAWGLNYQHCSHITFFPTHSYEQYYQSIRRCWRFGQKNNVKVDIVMTEGERKIIDNMQRKAELADNMFQNLVSEMGNAKSISQIKKFNKEMELPKWL
jgi:SNF2 family DNA or RNA helicase